MHNLLMPFFTLDGSKIEVFETYFFDTVITQNDHPRYVKHVLGRIYVFFTLFEYWAGVGAGGGGGGQDWYTTFLCTFSSLYSSKIEVSETYFFFDIVIT